MANPKPKKGTFCTKCGKMFGVGRLVYEFKGKPVCYDCFQKEQETLLAAEEDRKKLYQYIKEQFSIREIPTTVINRIDYLIEKDKRTSNGIKYTLYYCLHVLGKTFNLEYIGTIVNNYYEEARDYASKQVLIKKKNEEIDLNVEPRVIKIDIKKLHEEKKPKTSCNIEDL